MYTSNKNFILRCRDGNITETRIGMEGICITHSCIPLYTVYMQHILFRSMTKRLELAVNIIIVSNKLITFEGVALMCLLTMMIFWSMMNSLLSELFHQMQQ